MTIGKVWVRQCGSGGGDVSRDGEGLVADVAVQMNGFYLVSRVQLDKERTGRLGARVKKRERSGLVTAGEPDDGRVRSLI